MAVREVERKLLKTIFQRIEKTALEHASFKHILLNSVFLCFQNSVFLTFYQQNVAQHSEKCGVKIQPFLLHLYAENHPNSNAFYCHGVNMNGF